MTTKDEKMKRIERRDLDKISMIAHDASFAAWNGGDKTALSEILMALKYVSFGCTMNNQTTRNKRFSGALKKLKSGLKIIEDA